MAQVAAALGMGGLPLIAFPLLRYAGRFDCYNAGAIAAHYGAVSVLTFAVGLAYLAQRNVAYEAHMPLFVAVLEAPGIRLGRIADSGREARWPLLLREVLLGKSIVLLLGGLAIGWLAGPLMIDVRGGGARGDRGADWDRRSQHPDGGDLRRRGGRENCRSHPPALF